MNHAEADGRREGVMHILAPSRFGGLETLVGALALHQRERGSLVRLVALLDSAAEEPTALSRLRDDGVRLEVLRFPPRRYLSQMAALRRVVLAAPRLVLHSHGYHADILLGMLRNTTPSPMISTAHGFTGGGLKNLAYERFQIWSQRRYDAIVGVARSVVERLRQQGIPPDRLFLIRNGWVPALPALSREHCRRELSLGDEHLHVAWIGRISPEKGLDIALRAFSCIKNERLVLHIIGEGSEQDWSRQLAIALNVQHRVKWHGVLSGASQYMAAFDALALTSRTEGTPMVLLEAMHAQLPIIATRVGGVPDMLNDRQALLVSPEDHVSFARALDKFASEPAAASARAKEAQIRVEREFSITQMVDSYEILYDLCFARRLPR